jgi:hypothetical protein
VANQWQRVAVDRLLDAGMPCGLLDRALRDRFVEMMPSDDANPSLHRTYAKSRAGR